MASLPCDTLHESSKTTYFSRRLLYALARAEALIVLGLHLFWILGKSTPLCGETTGVGFTLAAAPFLITIACGLLTAHPRIRAALLQVECLLHGTAALFLLFVLCAVVLRDPFASGFPYWGSYLFWSIALSFLLPANLAAHLRSRGERQLREGRAGMAETLFTGAIVLAAVLLAVSGLTWPPYFWTASLLLHAALVPASFRTRFDAGAGAVRPAPIAQRFSISSEGLLLIASMLLAQLHLFAAGSGLGTLSVKYTDLVDLYASPLLVIGALTYFAALRFRVRFITHIALVLLAAFAPITSAWPVPLIMGYGLTALFSTSQRQCGFCFASSAALMACVWIIGMLGFSVGELVAQVAGDNLVASLAVRVKIAAAILLILWLTFSLKSAFDRRRAEGEPREPAPVIEADGLARGLVFFVLCMAALAPFFYLMLNDAWWREAIIRPPRTAVGQPSGVCHAGYSNSDEEHAILDEVGVNIMRVDFHWRRIQPTPDTWDVERWDDYLDAAERNGRNTLALLVFDNEAVETSPHGKATSMYIAPEDVPLYLEYVRRTVSYYQDRVYAWEIWNEPNITRFWNGPAEEFYALARQAVDVVREVDPDARIIGPAMTGTFGVWAPAGIEALHAEGVLDKVDHPSMHLYVPDPRSYYAEFSRVIAAARKHGHPGSIWITELGDPDGGAYPWRASPRLLAEHALKSYTIATCFGIEKIVWYCFRDSGLESQIERSEDSEGFFGLLTHDNEWKPAAYAYSLFSHNCSDSEIRADLVDKSGGLAARQLRTALYRRENGESVLILWFEPGLRPDAHTRVAIHLGETDGVPLMHDITSGYTKPLLDDAITVTEHPAFITFTAKDSCTPVRLEAKGSPADALWLLLLAAAILAAAACAVQRP